MRTYDDTFSGEKIYPGKVRLAYDASSRATYNRSELDDCWTYDGA
jgi:hypothetical protein